MTTVVAPIRADVYGQARTVERYLYEISESVHFVAAECYRLGARGDKHCSQSCVLVDLIAKKFGYAAHIGSNEGSVYVDHLFARFYIPRNVQQFAARFDCGEFPALEGTPEGDPFDGR